MVMRSGRSGAPCRRFQSATVSAVATISWSLTVCGAPGARRGTGSSVTSSAFPGAPPGFPGATRATVARDPAGRGTGLPAGGRAGAATGGAAEPL